MSDLISRQAAIDAIRKLPVLILPGGVLLGDVLETIRQLPSAQPEQPLLDTYAKAVWTWLIDYQIKAAELEGRYAPYEVLSWVANDWRKEHDMPSAEPEPIRINLNEPIKVKLTDWGKEIYYHQYDRANQIAGREICKPKFPKEDENGYTEFQLWCFMELYGEHMGMTLPNVIEPLEIVYERRTG